MRMRMRVRTWKNPAWWFLLPSFAGVCIFYFIPYIDVFRRAFFSAAGGEFQGLDNFKTVLTNPAFQLAVKNTGLFMLVCIPLLLSLSLVIAVWIYRHSKIGNFLKTGFLLPMAIPVAAVVLLWRILFDDQGLLNGVLDRWGQEPVSGWIRDGLSSFWWSAISGRTWAITSYFGWRDCP